MGKSVDQRRTRRSRYAAAIDPLRKRFSCTAAEAAGHVNKMFSDNDRLSKKVADIKACLDDKDLTHENQCDEIRKLVS